MASFLHADLPSDDEEDEEYNPQADKSAPKDERDEAAQLGKRPRVAVPDNDNKLTIEDLKEIDKYDVRKQAKKVKISHLWELLNGRSGADDPASVSNTQLAPQPNASVEQVRPAAGPSATVSLAALCKTVSAKERKRMDTDVLWMRSLGLTSPRPQNSSSDTNAATHIAHSETPSFSSWVKAAQAKTAAKRAEQALDPTTSVQATESAGAGTGVSADSAIGPPDDLKRTEERPPIPEICHAARATAAAALAAAREGISLNAVRQANKVAVTESRRFAGKDIQVTVMVDKNSKEAQKAVDKAASVAAPKAGLDVFLAEIEQKKKVNVLDKTKADWQQLKASDTHLEEELEAHKRSGTQYLDKVDFLKRAEVREYELERDRRLASDVRTRGRL